MSTKVVGLLKIGIALLILIFVFSHDMLSDWRVWAGIFFFFGTLYTVLSIQNDKTRGGESKKD